MLTESQYNELVRVLLADVDALLPLVFTRGRPVSEAHIRIMAGTMRRWLVDGDLMKLLTPLRQSALFEVQGNSQAKAYVDRTNSIRYYLTAGVMVDGRPIRHIYESLLPETAVDRSFVAEKNIRLTLKKFLSQSRLYHNGNWFSTEQILRFMANKLGGNHLDFNRCGEWARLDVANGFLRYGGPGLTKLPEGCEAYLILEPSSQEIIGGVHLEVIAAAASFVQMEIDGVQLMTLRTEQTLLSRLRKLFRDPANFRMIEKSDHRS
jgi:hypothetical protein